jgi:DnaJ family protein B protein 11
MNPGDLNFVVTPESHEHYHRDGDHLYVTMEIPLVDALTGFSHEFTHLDGHQFVVNVNDVTECDHVMRVSGKGMPRRRGHGYGDLFITFDVDFPETLTEEQKKGIERFWVVAAVEEVEEVMSCNSKTKQPPRFLFSVSC